MTSLLLAVTTAALFATAAFPATTIAQAATPLPQPDPLLRQLDRLAGTWDGPGSFVDSAYSKAGSATATTTCGWSIDGFFLICQQSVMLDGTPAHHIAIYTYDPAAKKYRFYNVGLSRADVTQLSVTADAITYTGAFDDGAKHVLTRTLNVWSTPRSYRWRAEYSVDGGAHWTLMASGTASLRSK